MNIADILKGMNKKQLEDAVAKAKEFAATEKGKEFINELTQTGKVKGAISSEDKDKILQELKNNPDVAQKISDILNGRG